jgi:vesicle coat complex subunit
MPSRNKQLKKLLHFYWEVCPKYDDNGKLKQEMILVVFVFVLHLSTAPNAFLEVMLLETTS